MKNKTAAFEANLFNYQLKNSADEYGFNADDCWIVVLADEIEMNRIRKNYIPSVVSSILPLHIVEVYENVKTKLQQVEDEKITSLTKKEVEKLKLNYILAYNAKRGVS